MAKREARRFRFSLGSSSFFSQFFSTCRNSRRDVFEFSPDARETRREDAHGVPVYIARLYSFFLSAGGRKRRTRIKENSYCVGNPSESTTDVLSRSRSFHYQLQEHAGRFLIVRLKLNCFVLSLARARNN